MIFYNGPFCIKASDRWSSDSEWYLNQNERNFKKNHGPRVIFDGEAEGTIVGANLGTFLLLKGTPYMPSLKNTILFIEDTESGGRGVEFDRNLQSLIDLPDFSGVKGIVIGRFEKTSDINEQRIEAIIRNKPALRKIPVAFGFDFGHTTPIFTFPIGGQARLKTKKHEEVELEVRV